MNNYTTPKLKSYPPESKKEWYVWFRFKGKLIIIKRNINNIIDLKEKEIEGRALAKALDIQLSKGWIPKRVKNYTEKIEQKTILEVANQ